MAWPTSNDFGFDYPPNVETYEKVTINQLRSQPNFPIIFGLVIGKQDPKSVPSKKHPLDHYVLNFTVRDSPSDTVNASCWGTEAAVRAVSDHFTIGDVVRIKNPQIIEKRSEKADEKFKPFSSSHFELNLSPHHTKVTLFNGENAADYASLLHCPMHAPTDFLTLADVVYNCQNVEGMFVNLLVAVKDPGTLQELKSRDGRKLQKLQFTVFDQSHPAFSILVWDKETALFILKSCSQKSILLISEVKVGFNRFMKSMLATANSATIFIPNPDIPDARVLYQYAQTVALDNNSAFDDSNLNDGASGGQIYTIQQIQKLMSSSEMSVLEDTCGTIFGYISSLDIDGCSKIVSLRCPECKQLMRTSGGHCVNKACDVGLGIMTSPVEEVFDMVIKLTDHTGTLPRCLLYGQNAQNLLNCTVSEYINMTDNEKTTLKWQYLLEKFKVQFKISQVSVVTRNPVLRITSCTKAEPEEVSQFYKLIF